MAEDLVSLLLEKLVSIPAQAIEQELTLVKNVEKEVKKLSSNLQTIETVLNDAEKRQVKEKAVEDWLDKLKDTSYEMEDVLNEWSTALLKLQIEAVDNDLIPMKKVCCFIPSPCTCFSQVNKLALRHDIAHKIKDLNKTLDDINEEKQRYGFELNSGPKEIDRPKTSSLIDVSNIRGCRKNKVALVKTLLGKGSQEERSPYIISLVGMGGIGKTTLAQLAYNDDEVKAHFEIRMWICVSDPFDQIKVAKEIIQEAKGDSTNITDRLETLLQSICNLVEGKNFFLVLDDVWTEDEKKWEPFKVALTYGAQGSRILVTTRKEKVAMIVGSVCKFNLETLSEEDCWFIFSKIAFYEKDEEQRKNLEDLGRQIALKCKGLPLAAKTLGSLMRFKKTIEQWKDVLHSKVWELEDAEKDLFTPLLLSYFDLPSPVKRCYTYCAIFPKDHVFDREKMVKLWMAQGYLDSKKNVEMEIIGQEYFEMLAMRSFFQDFQKDKDGSITKCKMHDIVHDHAQSLMKNECFQIIVGENKKVESDLKVRHLTLSPRNDIEFPTFIYRAQNLRTLLILFGNSFNYQTVLPDLFRKLTCLRTLDLSWQSIKEIPQEVEMLIHLRYLDVSHNNALKEIPEMMCNLFNLQTLDVSGTGVNKLPKGIGKLINLRHLILDLRSATNMKPFPEGFGRLSSLRTLKQFTVGGNEDSKGCKLGELKILNHLRGELEINGLGSSIEVSEAENAQLKKKKHLRNLSLSFNGEENRRTENDESLLNALEPHPDLEYLCIEEYQGTTMFFNWLMSIKLKNLVLWGCNKLEFLPHLGRLPFLESLEIYKAESVKKVGVEFWGIESKDKKKHQGLSSSSLIFFPNLKYLKFEDLKEWEEWDGIGGMREEEEEEEGGDNSVTIMPRLHSLEIEKCPKRKALPHFLKKTPSQELIISGCQNLSQRCTRWIIGEDWPKISHITNIKIDGQYVQKLQVTDYVGNNFTNG